jgi:hypothetical protein
MKYRASGSLRWLSANTLYNLHRWNRVVYSIVFSQVWIFWAGTPQVVLRSAFALTFGVTWSQRKLPRRMHYVQEKMEKGISRSLQRTEYRR